MAIFNSTMIRTLLLALGLAWPHVNPEVVKLATNVFAVIRREPLGLAVNSNSLLIIGDSDVVVVDAQFTRLATLETIAVIRHLTPKPVGVVINTHWHDDHVAGNQVYRDSFPSVRFVMQANTAADFATLGARNRTATVQGAPPVADRYTRLLNLGLGIDSTPVSEVERASVASALRIIGQYVAEAPGFRAIAPDDTVDHRLTLRRGKTIIDVRWFGCGNTRGDLVIHLPVQRILATGDLVVAPVPFAFNAYPATWPGVLDSLIALAPSIIVPGHGPVMRDVRYVRMVRDMLIAARTDTLLDVFRRRIAGDEKWMNYLFKNFFLRPTVARTREQPSCP